MSRKNEDDDPKFRLRPRKPPIPKDRKPAGTWSLAFRTVMKYARTSRDGSRRRSVRPQWPHFQHCAVRLSYSTNRVGGHWRAHGRYVAREDASHEPANAGFDATKDGVDIASRLQTWQASGDPRLWKLIISPEFGERLDLQRLTRDIMARMESDLHRPLEWNAVTHFNTEHPHVHVALRGIDLNNELFTLDRDYVRNGLRSVARHFATVQLGYRTEHDAETALRRQIPVQRFSPLDRLILARGDALGEVHSEFHVYAEPGKEGLRPFAAVREQTIAARLMTLETMGLARADGPHHWRVRTDLETALRAMQRSADHQKTLAAHGPLLSDQRLQLSAPNWREITSVQGRVLSHGEDEAGNRYLLLEGTDGRVYYLRYTAELDEARSRGDLGTNTFVEINKRLDESRKRRITVMNLGDAEALLEQSEHFRSIAKRWLRQEIFPLDDERWNGWLGNYHDKLREAFAEVACSKTKSRGRSKGNSR